MEKLHRAMEKAAARGPAVFDRAGVAESSRRDRAEGPGAFVDPARVAPAEISQQRLRANKVLGQMMDGQRGWPGQRRAVEAFRMIRTRTRHTLEAAAGDAQLLAVTSPRQGDGKTLTSINLAMGMARQTTGKVLLIDADLRLPAIADVLGMRTSVGLSDYLSGTTTLEGCMRALPGGKLFIIPQLRSLPHSSELLANGVLARLAERIRREAPDWTVVIDCPPVLAVDDTLVILTIADKALLVVREGRTRRGEMRRAAEAIGRDKYLGAVLNDSRSASDRGQYYYYDYGYEKR